MEAADAAQKAKKSVKTVVVDQTEAAFQKQGKVIVNGNTNGRKVANFGKKGHRYIKNIGLSFKVPKSAIDGKYVDKKCPFTGNGNFFEIFIALTNV